MSVRAFAAIGGAALQLKPYKSTRSVTVAAAAAGRSYNQLAAYCTASSSSSSSGEIAREPEIMDQEKQTRPISAEFHQTKTQTDVMADSFGVEYTTRSEEEGFGVIRGDDPDPHPHTDPGQDKNHPDYKTSEGSELKEKEKEKEKEKAHKP